MSDGKEEEQTPDEALDEALEKAMEGFGEEEPEDTVEADKEPEAKQEEETPASEDDAAGPEPVEDEPKEPEEVGPSEDETEELKVSDSWSKEDRAIIDKMEPGPRQVLLQQSRNLQQGFTRKSMERAEDLKAYEDIASLYGGMQADLDQAGLNPVTATQNLVRSYQAIRQNPEAGLRQVMMDYAGTDLKGIVTRMAKDLGITPAADDGQADEYVDPTVQSLQSDVAAIKQSQARQVQLTQKTQTDELLNQIALFESATDDQGAKLHPHFTEVRNVMSSLMTNDRSLDMGRAYAIAIRSNDDHFNSLVGTAVTAAQAATDAKRQAKVVRSKEAGMNANSNRSPSKGPDKRLSDDEAMDAAWSKHKVG